MALILIALIVAFSSVPGWPLGILLWPGMKVAATVFPHSDSGIRYLVLTVILDVFFFSWPVFGVAVLIGRLRKHKAA